MMASTDHAALVAAQTEQLVQQSLRQPVCVSNPTLIAARGRSLVIRCRVTGWTGVESVVVKQYTSDDGRGFTDWASLVFLADIAAARGIAPRLYAGDRTTRIVVMEDLGGSHSLADTLDHGDVATVVRALRALAVPMARLVTSTAGQEQDFRRIRTGFPGAIDQVRQQETERWLAGRPHLERWVTALDLQLPRGFDGAFRRVAAMYADPGPYLVFSHGDPAPSNNHIRDNRVHLLDFEYGGYRHALYDLTAWYVLCPLPLVWFAELEDVFRHVIAPTSMAGLIHDEARYREAWAMMCAYRALAMLTWFPHDLLLTDHAWTPGWTMREACISTTRRLAQATADVTPLTPLAAFAARMAAAVQARWPELGDGQIRWPGVADTA
jgi:hypothetical protein